jgi:hypothetical protein
MLLSLVTVPRFYGQLLIIHIFHPASLQEPARRSMVSARAFNAHVLRHMAVRIWAKGYNERSIAAALAA